MWFRNIFGAKRSSPGDQIIAGSRAAITLAGAGQNAPMDPERPLALSANALRQLNRLHLNTGRLLLGYAVGMRPSQRRKPAGDFREHRMYSPGDDVRFVDWKASARQEHVFIKQGEHQKDAAVYLVLDCSASMAWGKPPKSTAALSLTLALGYLALAHGDRLTVSPMQDLDSDPQRGRAAPPLGPVSGKGQFPGLLGYLPLPSFRGQADLAGSLAALRSRNPTGSGLVVIISDLLGVEDLFEALGSLPAPSWNVVICHILHPLELNPVLNGDFEMQDIETGQKKIYNVDPKALDVYRRRLQTWRESLETACSERKALYTLIPSSWSLEGEIIPHLRNIQVVKPL